jgi:hypothetical protein
MFKYAVIHSGGAHRDEALALGLAYEAGLLPITAPVYRREPSVDELNDWMVLVLDVGDQYNDGLGNYDHHQLARGTRECALSLLAKTYHVDVGGGELITYHELFADRPWYQATVAIDSLGPNAYAKELGLKELPPGLHSPFEMAIIDMIGKSTEVDLMVKVLLAKVIGDRTRQALELRERAQWLKANAKIIPLPGGLTAVMVESKVQLGIDDFRKTLVASGLDVAISITHDDRGAGWSLYRFDDHPAVDFSRLDGNLAISFAHKSGFIAKTREMLCEGAVKALCEQALR